MCKKLNPHAVRQVIAALLILPTMLLTASCVKREMTFLPNEFTRGLAPVPNPMKGFAVFYDETETSPDASMEYIEVRFDEIYTYQDGQGGLTTEIFDEKLAKVADRGHSAIVRVYMLNPGYVSETSTGLFLPPALYDELKENGDIYADKTKSGTLEYPDFNSEKLIECMTDFIRLFAARYDGHAAIATIQMGLYGSWGEWNMSGCKNTDCVMTNENLKRVIEAYVHAFSSTKLMARNPSLGYANEFPIGYHDDNFLFNSSDYHTVSPEWKALLAKQDPSFATLQQFYDFINGNGGAYEPLWDAWKTQMFGGELSMQMYKEPFGSLWSGTERGALQYCIVQFHVTWLMGYGQGSIPDSSTAEYRDFLDVAGSFGYNLFIDSVSGDSKTATLTTNFGNAGVAPFYYDWEIEYRLTDADNKVVSSCRDTAFRLSQLLPGETAASTLAIPENLQSGTYTVYARFVNPAGSISKNAMPLRLSNDHELSDGFYELAKVTIA